MLRARFEPASPCILVGRDIDYTIPWIGHVLSTRITELPRIQRGCLLV